MDSETNKDSGEEMEMEEHSEALQQKWIEYYKGIFEANAVSDSETPPVVLEDRFREMLKKAVQICETGDTDGTVDMFVCQCLENLFRKWYDNPEAVEHWTVEIIPDIGETVFKVLRMMRGKIVAGADSCKISKVLWDLFIHVTSEFKTNEIIGKHLDQMNVEVDDSAEAVLIKPEFIDQKYNRMIVLLYDAKGFDSTAKFFDDNIDANTSVEELTRYLKAFRLMAIMMNHEKAFTTFKTLVYQSMHRLNHAKEEEMSCKNLSGPLVDHELYLLHLLCKDYAYNISELNKQIMLQLLRWRLRFLLKAVNEAPFEVRMEAVQNVTYLLHEFTLLDFETFLHGHEPIDTLKQWLKEDRAVDVLIRNNLDKPDYVDRVQKTFKQMLDVGIDIKDDMPTVWESLKDKGDVTKRNPVRLRIRIAPPERLEEALLKIRAAQQQQQQPAANLFQYQDGGIVKTYEARFDRVLIERVEAKAKRGKKNGNEALEGIVVAVGPGLRENGVLIPISLKVGDRVLLPEDGGSKVTLGDKEYLRFRDSDILDKIN